MNILKPELVNVNSLRQFPLTITHPYHMVPDFESVLNQGKQLKELGEKTGAGAVTRSGTFADAMLVSLDKVSAYQQFASSLNQQAITDPDSVDVHDITIAQAEASMSLNITRNILNRIVQSWRDLINTR
ncbi:MAG: flagellar hook-basal body complex protein FliE [Treponema sp.]|jgi:flagellar hook-basal body complex protein FliE|nr:flagellar hook-basal body complex protein FliE [Treponema sp.]